MRLRMALVTAVVGFVPLPSAAQSVCRRVTFQAHVEVRREEIALADLMAGNTCPPLRAAAVRISLGAAPRAGSLRVFTGDEIRRRVETLAGGVAGEWMTGIPIPERIAVRREATRMSCSGIARFLAEESSLGGIAGDARQWENEIDCAGARAVPGEAQLELTRSGWNPALQRWEFAVRCAHAEQCIPFLVWRRAVKDASGKLVSLSGMRPASFGGASPGRGGEVERLVKPGQTATLSWDEGGIRIVLPVTCLDAGGAGQMVRVRFKNTLRILRAEVLGDGTLRARL